MQVVPGLHRVDGMSGIANAYVWERPDGGLTLVDAGMPTDAARILAFLDRLDRGPVSRIIATHGDIDHIGGLAAVQAATGARVVCHAVEKDVIEGRQPRAMALGVVGALYSPLLSVVAGRFMGYRPVSRVDELVLDKQLLPEGLQVIHAPGHAAGQIALYQPERGILLTGDALVNGRDRLHLPAAIATPRMDVARDSVRKLAELKGIQVICCGHGPPITQDAEARLHAFAASLAN